MVDHRNGINGLPILAQLAELMAYNRSTAACVRVTVNHGDSKSQPLHADTFNPAWGSAHRPRTIPPEHPHLTFPVKNYPHFPKNSP